VPISGLRFPSRGRAGVRPRLEHGLLVALLVVAAGCRTAPPFDDFGADRTYLLEYGARLRSLTAREIDNLYLGLTVEHSRSPSASSAIRLALLLGYPAGGHYDAERALTLLDEVPSIAADGDAVSRRLADLLAALLSDAPDYGSGGAVHAARPDGDAATNGDTATDGDTALGGDTGREGHVGELEAELARTQASLAEERERSARLQRQLEALIALEEQLNHGGRPVAPPVAAPEEPAADDTYRSAP
jgi:hypothetical protein